MAKETETSGSKKKRYYFLRLPQDHHKAPMMERLIHRHGNEGYGLYMRLLEMTVSNTGFLKFDHVENTIEEQAAFDLKITDDQARELISTLEKLGLAERIKENPEEDDPGGLFLIEGEKYTAKECESAGRVRDYRKNKKEAEEAQALQCNGEVLQSDDNKNKSKKENKNLEKDVDTDIHLSLENSYSLKEESGGAACGGAAEAAPAPPASSSSSSSSSFLDKIRELNGKKKKNRLSEAGLAAFAAETKEGAELWGNPIEGGLSKALNGWAKKTAEKGKHAEYFDDGTGQNAAAPDGAGQDHAGQDHAGPDGTSAAPGKAAPDQSRDQAASTTTAQDEAKEKQLKAEKEQAEKEAEALKKKLEEAERAAKIAQQQAEQREKVLKYEAEKADTERRKLERFNELKERYSEVCREIDKLPGPPVRISCSGDNTCCRDCTRASKCSEGAFAALKTMDRATFDVFGEKAMPYFMAKPHEIDLRFDYAQYLRQVKGVVFHEGRIVGYTGKWRLQKPDDDESKKYNSKDYFLDNPYERVKEKVEFYREIAKKLKEYYREKPYCGVPEAIARFQLGMHLPFEAELFK